MENTTMSTEALRANVRAAHAAFLRALAAANEINDRIEAAGGTETGYETAESVMLMGLWKMRDERLIRASEDLRLARLAARPQLTLPGFAAEAA